MATVTWLPFTDITVFQKFCFSIDRPLQFSDRKGYFVSNHCAVFGLLCGCWDGKTAVFASTFRSCNALFHIFLSVRSCMFVISRMSQTYRSQWVILSIYIVSFYREKTNKAFQVKLREAEKETTVLFFSLDLNFSEASSLSTNGCAMLFYSFEISRVT